MLSSERLNGALRESGEVRGLGNFILIIQPGRKVRYQICTVV